MKVSIIIPVYNAEPYLTQTLDSVLSQRFWGQLEVIAVNDGSSDGSAEIMEDYRLRDNRVKVIHKENEGQASARNIGLDNATGDYIIFVDADDLLLEGAVSHLFSAVSQAGTPMAMGRIVILKNPSETLKSLKESRGFKIIDSDTAISRSLYRTKIPLGGSVCGNIFARYLFDDIRFVKGLYYEDLEIMPRLLHKAAKIAIVDSPVYCYRTVAGSFMHRWSPVRCHVFKVLQILANQSFIQSNPHLERAVGNREFCAACNILLLAWHAPVDESQLIEQCYSIIKKRRLSVLFDTRSRLKAQLGALLSYFGKNIFVKTNDLLGIVK